MIFNENTAISTQKVLLVPYDAHHVPKYHAWMEDSAIQEATASERLTLDEEYENQQSWRTSADKLTFIVCKPLTAPSSSASEEKDARAVVAGQADAPDRMVGDINLFLTPSEENEVDEFGTALKSTGDRKCVAGEVDIMIAEPANRGRGVGKGAAAAFLLFVRRNLRGILDEYTAGTGTGTGTGKVEVGLKELVVKIRAANVGSIALFRGLGFVQRGAVNYFGEIEMCLGDLDGIQGLARAEGYAEVKYDRSGLEA